MGKSVGHHVNSVSQTTWNLVHRREGVIRFRSSLQAAVPTADYLGRVIKGQITQRAFPSDRCYYWALLMGPDHVACSLTEETSVSPYKTTI